MYYTSKGEHLNLYFETKENALNQRIHLILSQSLESPDDFMKSVVDGFEQKCVTVQLQSDMVLSLSRVFKNQKTLEILNSVLESAYYPFFAGDERFELVKGDNGASLFLDNWERLDIHRRNLITWILHFICHAQPNTILAVSYPEFSLPLRMHYAWFNALQTVLNEVDGVAVVMTESPLLIQNVPTECAWLPVQTGTVYSLYRPNGIHFAENLGNILRECCNIDEKQSYWWKFLKEQADKGISLTELIDQYPDLGGMGKLVFKVLKADSR